MLCLTLPSDDAWAQIAVGDMDALLVDHAHCELKAASNALSLAARFPEQSSIVRALAGIAHEESGHFQRVLDWLERRGCCLGAPPVDFYAAELRRNVRELPSHRGSPLVDRLLVGALIEARSCERFKLLVEALTSRFEIELRDFYAELLASEARHYRTFVELACEAGRGVLGEAVVLERLARLAVSEGDIVSGLARQERRATIHG